MAAGRTGVNEAPFERHRLLRSAATIGLQQNERRECKLPAKHRALDRRILARETDYLRFAVDFRVPFDNNAAEREIRMIKVKQEVSGCLHTLAGAEAFCTIRSHLATAPKHGIRYFEALTLLAEGRPWTRAPA